MTERIQLPVELELYLTERMQLPVELYLTERM